MIRDSWLIDATELDNLQKTVLEADLHKNLVVTGCAGSGKTILALHQIRRLKAQKGNESDMFFFIIRTHALRDFVKSGLKELGIKIDRVQIYSEWKRANFGGKFFIIDEAQDFSKSEFLEIINRADVIHAFGDDDQRIFEHSPKEHEETLAMAQIRELLKALPIDLPWNYRTPKSFAQFAEYFLEHTNFSKTCVREHFAKPIVKQFSTPREEIEWIANEISTKNLKDVAILVPYKEIRAEVDPRWEFQNVEFVKNILESKGLRPEICRTEVDERGTPRIKCEFDFENLNNPKIITYSNCKGLQFDTVYVPFRHREYAHRLSLFVALTRAKNFLIISYSNTLSKTFLGIPKELYTI